MHPAPAEQMTLGQDTKVRLAPSESAITLFMLKGGSIIKVESRAEEWIRIESPDGTGWIRK
jgi:SH3-like domain-containing protein